MKLPSLEWLQAWLMQVPAWVEQYAATRATISQLGFLAIAALAARWLGLRLAKALEARARRLSKTLGLQIALAGARVVPWIVFLFALWIGGLSFEQAGEHARLIRLAETLTLAWVAIRLSSLLLRDSGLTSTIAILAWVVAALSILDLLDPLVRLLDSTAFEVGRFHLSILVVLKAALLLIILIWLANAISRFLERRLRDVPQVPPAMQVLILKLSRIALLAFAVAIALGSVGIDLTGFAVFSGAIGVGVGFGLQKVVSNLVSGVILLLDRSIKPGDVIEIDNTYGWITKLNARFVSVITRDGTEYLIPNEDLITQRVTNWSYSNDLVRLKVPIGIGYSSDVPTAIRLAVEAAKAVERILPQPEPTCLLTGFGDNSVNLELRFWIGDPRNGTANVRSKVLLGIWERFRTSGVEFPFPQRDLHLRNAGEIAKAVMEAMSPLRPEPGPVRTGHKPRVVD